MADTVGTAKTELITEVWSVLRNLQNLPAQVTGFFQAPHTNYTEIIESLIAPFGACEP